MKLTSLFVLVIASTIIGSGPPQSNSDKTTLFVNKCDNSYDIGFSYVDKFDQMTSYGKIIHLNGGQVGKQFTVNLQARTLVTFNRNFFMYPIFINPGDTLEIHCTDEDRYEFNLKGERQNKELNFLIEIEKRFGFSFIRMAGLNLSDRTNFAYLMEQENELYQKKQQFVSDAFEAKQISKSCRDEVMQELLCKHALEILTPYTIESPTFNIKNIPSSYVDALLEFRPLISVDSLMSSATYRKFLYSYSRFLSFNSNENENPSLKKQFKQIRHHFRGKAADYLQLKALISSKEKGQSDVDELSNEFVTNCTDTAYVTYYQNFLAGFNPSIDKRETVSDLGGNTLTWEQVLQNNKSKLIFIDFWASWCGPCIGEMPDSKKLQDALKDKDISFMYVSIDDDKQKWVASARKLPIDYKTTTHLLTDRNSSLSKAFNIPPIPRYVIINRSGEVLASDAPRPSDPKLIGIIDDLLNRN